MACILLVEDDPGQLSLRRTILENAGHSVLEAATAAEALAQFETHTPVVVVMDLRIPRVEDGVRLIRKIGDARPVIVVSGALAQFPGEIPVFRLFSKPFRSAELLSAIAEAASSNGN